MQKACQILQESVKIGFLVGFLCKKNFDIQILCRDPTILELFFYAPRLICSFFQKAFCSAILFVCKTLSGEG